MIKIKGVVIYCMLKVGGGKSAFLLMNVEFSLRF